MSSGFPEPTAVGMATRSAIILFVFVVVFTALLAGTYQITRPTLLATAAAEKMKLIGEVLPAELYDNDLLQSPVQVPADPLLGSSEASTGYLATRAAQPVALVFETTAPDGYSGRIRLLLAVRADGRLLAVRVIEHKETPGLGDYIEPKKDRNKTRPWISQFAGVSLEERPASAWKVKKDGGEFDAYTGATVSARAVVRAALRGVQFVRAQREVLFAPAAGESR